VEVRVQGDNTIKVGVVIMFSSSVQLCLLSGRM